jgi:hypothetical protein
MTVTEVVLSVSNPYPMTLLPITVEDAATTASGTALYVNPKAATAVVGLPDPPLT